MVNGELENAGQGWQGSSGQLQLMGWQKSRRVIVLRRRIPKDVGIVDKSALSGQTVFQFADMGDDINAYEYAVLVSNLDSEILTLGSHYRDRADSENNFDEVKNQWGGSGFTTNDLHRCRLMARIIALIYNWWTLFVRLIEPNSHLEAITSRPLLLHAVGRQIQHAGQKIIQVSSHHGKFKSIQLALSHLSAFFKTLRPCAEQLSKKERMRRYCISHLKNLLTLFTMALQIYFHCLVNGSHFMMEIAKKYVAFKRREGVQLPFLG